MIYSCCAAADLKGNCHTNWECCDLQIVLPQSDAGLSHHLRAEVLGGQFERRLHEPQLLRKPVKLCGTGQEQRTHLLQLEEKEKRRSND